MSLAVPQSYADLKALVSRMRTAGFSSHFNASFDATMAKVDAVEAARQRGEDAYAIKQLEENAMSNISKVINKSNQSYNETLADIQTKAANYANFAATPEAANSTEAKQRAAALARDIEGFNANFAGLQEPYVAPTLKANKSGYLEQVNESGATKS